MQKWSPGLHQMLKLDDEQELPLLQEPNGPVHGWFLDKKNDEVIIKSLSTLFLRMWTDW